MVIKGYFDGGNQEVAGEYDRITLAVVCGTVEQWQTFEEDRVKTLDLHGVKFLHTTDAASLRKEFSRAKGWNTASIDALLHDCAEVADRHLHREFQRPGLCAVTLTIAFDDDSRARIIHPELPNTVTEICATECLSFALKWGKFIGAAAYELYFDQGEPFYGPVYDRRHNKKSKKAISLMSSVVHLGESDMRISPALQLADLFAWCGNHQPGERSWHKRINDLHWAGLYLGYEHLLNPRQGVLDLLNSWNLPPRSDKL